MEAFRERRPERPGWVPMAPWGETPGYPQGPSKVAPWRRRAVIPYASWLNAGDNSWQMTAGTLVGLMSIPALAVLYGGLVQKKWAMNTVRMGFPPFGLLLIVWLVWEFKLGFGPPLVKTFIGDPRTIRGAAAEQGQTSIPL